MTSPETLPEEHPRGRAPAEHSLWVERLALTNFRNYASLTIEAGAEPQVIAGANGSGKTNMLEALSLLAPGQGMRRAPFNEIPRSGGDGGFAVAARVHTLNGAADIGTGLQPGAAGQVPGGRSKVTGPGNGESTVRRALRTREIAAALCASTAWRRRGRACSRIISKSSG